MPVYRGGKMRVIQCMQVAHVSASRAYTQAWEGVQTGKPFLIGQRLEGVQTGLPHADSQHIRSGLLEWVRYMGTSGNRDSQLTSRNVLNDFTDDALIISVGSLF